MKIKQPALAVWRMYGFQGSPGPTNPEAKKAYEEGAQMMESHRPLLEELCKILTNPNDGIIGAQQNDTVT